MTAALSKRPRQGSRNAPLSTVALTCVLVTSGFGGCVPVSERELINAERVASNDRFRSSEALPLSTVEAVAVAGRIGGASPVDVFDVRPFEPGHDIVVNVRTRTDPDLKVAVFDEDGVLIAWHHGGICTANACHITLVVPAAEMADVAFVAIASDATEPADYDMTVILAPPAQQAWHRETVLLDFDGANAIPIADDLLHVPAFDAKAIAFEFEGRTRTMVDEIRRRVRENFAAFDIDILDAAFTDDAFVSVVHVGGEGTRHLGIADMVPSESGETQHAVVFAESFDLFMPLQPSASEMAVALANVITHEIGHLVGLAHVDHDRAVMARLRPPGVYFAPVYFLDATLSPGAFPIGRQDSICTLSKRLGESAPGAAELLRESTDANLSTRENSSEEKISVSSRSLCLCSCERCIQDPVAIEPGSDPYALIANP